MHLYWRIIEELKYLGEIWEMNDPSLKRCFGEWIQKNNRSISISFMDESLSSTAQFNYKGIICSNN